MIQNVKADEKTDIFRDYVYPDREERLLGRYHKRNFSDTMWTPCYKPETRRGFDRFEFDSNFCIAMIFRAKIAT